ncbi:hypothetical protein [Maridesulfovibrio sp.]
MQTQATPDSQQSPLLKKTISHSLQYGKAQQSRDTPFISREQQSTA